MGGTVRLYKSTDASAPTLTGQVGTLITVLDAILVSGYGSMTAAGWSKPYTNSGNLGCYRMATTGNSGSYLQINDNGPGAGGAREARIYGFNAMSALDTGTGRFPTSSLLAIGSGAVVCRKSSTADATARAWWCVADDSVFYFSVETGDYTSPLATMTIMFGDIFSMRSSDATRAMIIGRNVENTNSHAQECFPLFNRFSPSNLSPLSDYTLGHFMNGHWNQVVSAIAVGKFPDFTKMQLSGIGGQMQGSSHTQTATATAYNGGAISGCYISMGMTPLNLGPQATPSPNPVDGGVMLSPVWVCHNGCIRGYLKGIWSPCSTRPLGHGDTLSGAGNLSGKSFVNLNVLTGSSSGVSDLGNCFFEYSNTWS